MVTAGLDLRWMTSPQTPDPKRVAHNPADELAFQLLCVPFGDEGIYKSPLFRRSRPAVMHSATSLRSLCHLLYYSQNFWKLYRV